MARPQALDVLVIGAGSIGMACASYLQRDGHRVTVVDRNPPGMACSFGNLGGIGDSSIVPVSSPGIWKKVPKWLLDPLGPLALRPAYFPRLVPFLLRFMAAGRPGRVEEIVDATRALTGRAWESWHPLFIAAGVDNLVHHTGVIHLYPDRAAREADDWQWRLRRERGLAYEEWDRAELHRQEPAVGEAYRHAVYEPGWKHVASPFLIVDGLASHFARQGGTVLRGEVRGFAMEGGRVAGLDVDGRTIKADRVVLAGGAWSHRLSAKLGDPAPLESQRGYHVMLPKSGVEVRHIMMDSVGKLAVTPMVGGLRIGGTSEFAGVDAPPDWRRAEALVKAGRRIFPGLDDSGKEPWAGDRPLLPDSLPVIGPAPRHPNVIYAFGHSHIGLTLGGITGRLVADLVAARKPEVDLAPYRIGRFR